MLRSTRILVAIVAIFGCGSSAPPTSNTTVIINEPAGPASEEPPIATMDGGAAPETTAAASPPASAPAPRDARCPTTWDRLEGAACSPEGLACRNDICRDAKGFCNVMVCRSGRWAAVEVPPPAPTR